MSEAPRSRNGRHVLSGKNTVAFNVDTSGLDSLFADLGEAAEAAIRPAAQAAAQVLYDRVKANVAGIGRKTGNLANSIYQVYSESGSTERQAMYSVSWNHKKAPHGHLLEYGYLQRYRYYQGNDGKIRPMVRPGMEGRPRPGRRASPEQKAAYYVTLPMPIHVPGRAFMRSAMDSMDKAYQAAQAELFRRIDEKVKLQ